ncbi:MAG: efflux RND transporter periplasmic adaptor subunit [Bacteroidetes bacterium]|nr:efflux RND transporter periplasmic adaptor subunit [Bacteroidota bacterium]
MDYLKFLLLSVYPLFLLSGCNKKEYISPENKNITESAYASGIIKSKNQYQVFSKTNGILEKAFVKEGARIKIGDPLFQMDNKNSKVATRNALLASATADFAINSDRLKDALNSVQMAMKKLSNDSLLFARQKILWNSNIGTRNELEQKELNFENSKVALTRAKVTYEDLQRQLKLASGQSKNNYEIAKLLEKDLIIRSDLDGVVYQINKEQGELASSLSPLAVVGADDFIIELNIDELDIVKIKPGQQVIVRMDSYKSQIFEATITSIYPMMNERTRTFIAEAVFTKRPIELYPNLTLEANIVIHTKQNVLTIPRSYLVNDSTVMLQNGKMQQVELGLMDYNLVEIKKGLTAHSKIALPEK